MKNSKLKDPTVKVAVIAATASVLVAFITGFFLWLTHSPVQAQLPSVICNGCTVNSTTVIVTPSREKKELKDALVMNPANQ